MEQQFFEEFICDSKCLIEKDTYIENLARIAPYYFSTPRPITGKQLRIIGLIGSRVVNSFFKEKGLNIIGVARSGVPIAASICESITGEMNNCNLFVIDVNAGFDKDITPHEGGINIVVDNAIITGETLRKVADNFHAKGLKLDLVISLFSHEVIEMSKQNILDKAGITYELEIVYLFQYRDLILKSINDKNDDLKMKYLAYAKSHGTKILKEYICKEGF